MERGIRAGHEHADAVRLSHPERDRLSAFLHEVLGMRQDSSLQGLHTKGSASRLSHLCGAVAIEPLGDGHAPR